MFKRCNTLSKIKFQSHTFHKRTLITVLHLTQLSYDFKNINRLTKLSEHNLQKIEIFLKGWTSCTQLFKMF